MAEIPYYVGSDLNVTNMTVTYKASTVPVSSIESVRVQRVARAKVRWYLQALGLGVALPAGAWWLHAWNDMVAGFSAPPISSQFSMLEMVMVFGGAAVFMLALVGLVQIAGRRDVVVGLLSSSTLVISVGKREADEVKRAVEQALNSREIAGRHGISAADELGKLATLRASGILSAEDWDRAKEMYLGKRPDARGAVLAHLQGLHKLYIDGVLSLSEFNTKKWEVLSRRE